jgi:3,2-trans-enoyl-CoA isomerase
MTSLDVTTAAGVATVSLNRGKVNALHPELVESLRLTLDSLEQDRSVRALVLTGRGPFFSFGFDVPAFLSFTRAAFTDFLLAFTDLYTRLFVYPKPVVAALNGHTIAGGCMLALACDRRLMVASGAKIALNEITFGSSVPAGSVEMLRFLLGSARATDVLYSGTLYSAEEGRTIGLVDRLVPAEALLSSALEAASELGARHGPTFAGIKRQLRQPVADQMMARERASIEEFVPLWYSEFTRAELQGIIIR